MAGSEEDKQRTCNGQKTRHNDEHEQAGEEFWSFRSNEEGLIAERFSALALMNEMMSRRIIVLLSFL